MSDHVHRQQGCCRRKYRDAVSRIAFLEEKVKRLELENHKLRHRSLERPFGLSTPSSRQLAKPSAPETAASEEAKRRMGGAKGGHAGHGRRKADDFRGEVEELSPLDVCPRCGGRLEDFAGGSGETREIVDCELPRVRRRRIRRRVHYCPHCRKPVRAGIPGVIPKFALSDNVIAGVMADHCLHQIPMGTIARRLGVGKGTLFNAMHRVAEISRPVVPVLREMLRAASVKHADETGWRTDGRNGYTWIFTGGNIRLFDCRDTRGSSVPREVLGEGIGVGSLMTDRHGGYGLYRDRHYFRFEHLRRDVLKIVEDNPGSHECRHFSGLPVPLPGEAMGLRGTHGNDHVVDYLLRAAKLRRRIEEVVRTEGYSHPSVLNVQEMFRDNDDHLRGWAMHPKIPAENNAAERAVRPLVVARKISHGSQSAKGRETRSVLMSLMHTLNACCDNPVEVVREALDKYAENPGVDIFHAYFGNVALCVSER